MKISVEGVSPCLMPLSGWKVLPRGEHGASSVHIHLFPCSSRFKNHSRSVTERPSLAQARRFSHLETESKALRMSQKVRCVDTTPPTCSRWFRTCSMAVCVPCWVRKPCWFGCRRPWACRTISMDIEVTHSCIVVFCPCKILLNDDERWR